MHFTSILAAAIFFCASCASAWIWVRYFLHGGETALTRILCTLVLWQAIELVPTHLLASLQLVGLLAKITVPSLAVVQATILLGSIIWLAALRSRQSKVDSIKRTITGPRSSTGRLPAYLYVATFGLVVSYMVFAVNAFTSFPTGWDSLAYHLPLALRWLQEGSLSIPASRVWQFSLPGNAEIGMMVLLSTGTEGSAILVNWIAAVVLTLAIYRLAMSITAGDRAASCASSLIVLSIPIVEFQCFVACVDLYGTAFLMAAFSLLLSGINDGVLISATGEVKAGFSLIALFLSALACGVSIGTKPIYLFYGGLYVLLVGVMLLKKKTSGKLAVPILVVVAGILLPSLFWFGRALLETHNPVYPIQLQLRGRVLLAGYDTSAITSENFEQNFVSHQYGWFTYPWTEWRSGDLLVPYTEGSGVGAAFATFIPLSLVFLLAHVLTRRSKWIEQLLVLVFLACSLGWWFLMHRVPRFGLPVLAIGCLVAAPVLTILQSRKKIFGVLFACSVLATCFISDLVPSQTLVGYLRGGRRTRSDSYKYPQVIDQLPAGARVLNYTRQPNMNYALAGEHLTNRVVASFEAREELIPAALQVSGIHFIVEKVQDGSQGLTPMEGITLIETNVVTNGGLRTTWRVWRINP